MDSNPPSPTKQPTKAAAGEKSATRRNVSTARAPQEGEPRSRVEIEKLDEGVNFQRWLDRFNLCCELNSWNPQSKNKLLLMKLSNKLYDAIADRAAPRKPSEQDFDTLVRLLSAILDPKTFVLAERFTFQHITRSSGQSIREFAQRLCTQAEKCQFGEAKDERLRDQFLFGLNEKVAIGKLLEQDHAALTFEEAIGTAEAHQNLTQSQIVKSCVPDSGAADVMKIASMNPGSQVTDGKCGRCGKHHSSKAQCPAKGKQCNKCGMLNHFSSVCRSKQKGQAGRSFSQVRSDRYKGRRKTTNFVDGDDRDCFNVLSGKTYAGQDFRTEIAVIQEDGNKVMVKAQIDTGAGVSVMSQTVWRQLGSPKMNRTDIVLTTYADTRMKVLGKYKASIIFEEKLLDIEFFVVKSRRNFVLLGRDKLIFTTNSVTTATESSAVFQPVTLQLKDGVKPVHCKPRPLPFALKEAVKAEIDKMQSDGIIKPVKFSEWASPIVAVKQASGKLRLCVDYKVTVNPHLISDSYPLPTPDEVLATAAGSKLYTRLDLERAYHQIELDEASKQLTVMSTPFGMFAYNKLPFGIKTAPAIFQRFISQVLQGIQGTIAYMDDILICGRDMEELKAREREVLDRINHNRLKVNYQKSAFRKSNIAFLGFVLEEGKVRPDPAKVKAIREMAPPTSVEELESFLGLVAFSGRFIKHLSDLTMPLNRLRRKNTTFQWTAECQQSFDNIKQALSNNAHLQIFDPSQPIELECDCSQKALGGVLSQNNKPVLYLSKTLSDAETKYSQIEREALALVWCIQRCHRFLFGRKFLLITDHQPLTFLFAPHKEFPARVSARLQRWAISLSAYDYEIQYRQSKEMKSDALSRLVYKNGQSSPSAEIGLIEGRNPGIIQLDEIKQSTAYDQEMAILMNGISSGSFHHPAINKFVAVRDEFTVIDDIIYRQDRIVLPQSLRHRALEQVHSTHLGIDKTKYILRGQFWWPGMDKQIANYIGKCNVCKAFKAKNRNYRQPWPEPSQPWERIHVDFAGPIQNKYLLVVVDAYSGYPEVFITSDMKSDTVITRLRRLFSQLGVPTCLVSDNGPSFVSERVTEWLSSIGCSHVTTPPYHPQSNGIAERLVRTVKESIKINGFSQRSIDRFLLFYRSAVAKKQRSPAELMYGRNLRLPLSTKSDQLSKCESTCIYKPSQNHQPTTVRFLKPLGQNTALVETEDGRTVKSHLDQLTPGEVPQDLPGSRDEDSQQPADIVPMDAAEKEPNHADTTVSITQPPKPPTTDESLTLRRSDRLVRKPRVFYRT